MWKIIDTYNSINYDHEVILYDVNDEEYGGMQLVEVIHVAVLRSCIYETNRISLRAEPAGLPEG